MPDPHPFTDGMELIAVFFVLAWRRASEKAARARASAS